MNSIWPHRTHLYLISRGSIGDEQWLQVAGPSASKGFLSVRLQERHLYKVMRFVMNWAGLAAFFNLPIISDGLPRSIAYADEVSEYSLAKLGIIDLWMELDP